MNEDKELRDKRIKIYLAPLLPIHPQRIAHLDTSLIDITKSQIFILTEDDLYREIFAQILYKMRQCATDGKNPSYKIVTVEDLVSQHFTNESLKDLCFPDVLFVIWTSSYFGNPIYVTVCSKIIEERNLLNRRTYLYFKGRYSSARAINLTEGKNVVNYVNDGVKQPVSLQGPVQYQKFNVGSTDPSEELDEEEEETKKVKRNHNKNYSSRKKKDETKPKEVQEGPIKAVDNERYGGLV